jgi:5-methylcytosine-specific restriction protein B
MTGEPGQVFAVVRLGGDSELAIRGLDSAGPETDLPITFEINCKQVPREVTPGAFALIWLGTNNNKGGATPWVQGLRALGRITSVEGGPQYNDEKTVGLSVGVVLPQSLEKKDFIRETGADYIRIADMPVVGINNYSSQVVQRIDPTEESQQLNILLQAIARLSPGFAEAVEDAYPEVADVLNSVAEEDDGAGDSDGEETEKLPVELPEGDAIFTQLLARVHRLMKDGFGGVILRGAPGTSKSWYARRIAAALADRDPSRIKFVQFHPSYQYEDFVEGFVPDPTGTFKRRRKHFLQICAAAANDAKRRLHVLVIDELSRTDPARVFGEALTYLESTKRGEVFHLASGREMAVPPNLFIIATMNVWDRGVDEVDAAVERRFASISLDPSTEALVRILAANRVRADLQGDIVRFFEQLQRDRNPMVRVGHAYFRVVRDESSLHRLWRHQLRFVIERAFPLGEDGFRRIEGAWEKLFPEDPEGKAGSAERPPTADQVA